MKFFFTMLLVVFVAVSMGVDYLWKRWVARQREYRQTHPDEYPK